MIVDGDISQHRPIVQSFHRRASGIRVVSFGRDFPQQGLIGTQNGKVLGAIIWDATRNPFEETVGWIAIYYPEVRLLDVGSAPNDLPAIETIPLTDTPFLAPSVLYGLLLPRD